MQTVIYVQTVSPVPFHIDYLHIHEAMIWFVLHVCNKSKNPFQELYWPIIGLSLSLSLSLSYWIFSLSKLGSLLSLQNWFTFHELDESHIQTRPLAFLDFSFQLTQKHLRRRWRLYFDKLLKHINLRNMESVW